jgi:hypothetical protein
VRLGLGRSGLLLRLLLLRLLCLLRLLLLFVTHPAVSATRLNQVGVHFTDYEWLRNWTACLCMIVIPVVARYDIIYCVRVHHRRPGAN